MSERDSTEESKLAFYQGHAVHSILKRYAFNENEKKIIQDAIDTAKRSKPNMKTIIKSDALLKMVASSREPLPQEDTIDPVAIAKAVAQTNMKQYKAPQSMWTKPIEKHRSPYSILYIILAGAIFSGIFSYATKSDDNVIFSKAKQICHEKQMLLPLTIDDFIQSGDTFLRPNLFWLADGKVMMTNTWGKDTANTHATHHFICVSKNGLQGDYSQMFPTFKY